MVLWDNACYTKNDNYALNSWCFEERRGDSRTVDFDGKVENLWLEAKTKHVPELLVLKTEIKSFWEVHDSSTNASRQPNHFLC